MEENNTNINNSVNNGVNNKSQSKETETTKTNGTKQIAGAIVIAGLLIAGAILLNGSKAPVAINEEFDPYPETELRNIRPVSNQDHILGNPNAELIIVEYSDTQCPFCKVFHTTMHKIVESENGKVAWVYRHYPIEQLHKKAFNESLASECAYEQGGNDTFWKYTDEVYKRTGSNDNLEESELPKIAQDLGLNIPAFEVCLSSQKYADKVNNDIIDGELAGVEGTPTSFIIKDGKVVDMIEGAQPYKNVKDKIDKLLK